MVAVPVPDEPQGNYSKVREAYEACDGDLAEAKVLLRTWIVEDPDLEDYLITAGLERTLQGVSRRKRESAWKHYASKPNDPTAGDTKDSRFTVMDGGLESLAVSTLFDYPLAGGLKLGDATKPQLLENANYMFAQARENVIRARWLSMIADSVPFGQSVADVLKEGDLQRLMLQAKEAA